MPYIAMNNFQVAADQATSFEERWRRRRSYLQGVPGFETFQLLRGEERDGVIHYVSHSTWASQEAFIDWTHSDSFVQAHRGEPLPKGMVQGPPHLECFQVVELEKEA
jgi:heme-degrading monooxygenase HmoA